MRSPEENYIRLVILTKLLATQGLRYSEMQPENIEGDLFNYHLQALVKGGYVTKSGSEYQLTDKGKIYISQINPIDTAGKKIEMFKNNVWLLVVRKQMGQLQILNRIRKRQPFFGERGVPGGPIQRGEPILEAASRKLKETTGLQTKFKHLGIIRKIVRDQSGQLVYDILFYVCFSSAVKGELSGQVSTDEYYWNTLTDAIHNEQNREAPNPQLVKILKLIKSGKPLILPFFYAEDSSVIKTF